MVFKGAGFCMCLIIGPSLCHTVTFMQFVYQDVATFRFFNCIVDPNLVFGYEFVYMVMPAFGKIDIVNAADKTAIDYPHADSVLQLLP